jgi:hypothetical protein
MYEPEKDETCMVVDAVETDRKYIIVNVVDDWDQKVGISLKRIALLK